MPGLGGAHIVGLGKSARRAELLRGRRIPWQPVITQGAAITYSESRSWYSVIGGWCIGSFAMTLSSSGTAANSIKIGMPVDPAFDEGYALGSGLVYVAATATRYPALMEKIGARDMWFADASVAGTSWALGNSSSLASALVSGDSVSGTFQYPV